MKSPNIITISETEFIIKTNLVRVATVKEEWDKDISDPLFVIDYLKKGGHRVDLFSFVQRLPESNPKYAYRMQWESVAAIPISSYGNWFKNQIPDQARNKIKKASKLGVEIREVKFEDELIKGISDLYNDTLIRQGRKNRHYNLPYETVKKLNITYLDRSQFVAAYYNNEFVGYLKIVYTDRFARVMGILGKQKYRDKSPMNLLIAKAVEICADKRVPFFVYGKYNYGKLGSDSLKEFKKNNGFESYIVPRYYIPLNNLGEIALRAKIHEGFKNMLPEWAVRKLLNLRAALNKDIN